MNTETKRDGTEVTHDGIGAATGVFRWLAVSGNPTGVKILQQEFYMGNSTVWIDVPME